MVAAAIDVSHGKFADPHRSVREWKAKTDGQPDTAEAAREIAAIVAEMAAEPVCTFQQPAVLY